MPSLSTQYFDFDMHNQVTCTFWCDCIQGWRIDEVMMNIFQQCWPTMNKLHTIKYASSVNTLFIYGTITVKSMIFLINQCTFDDVI